MMKNFLLLGFMALFAFTSCEKTASTTPQEPAPQEVEFTLNYSFAESGPMAKSGATVYNDFYEKYIKTQILTPDSYVLTFSNKVGVVATFNGKWADMDMVKLQEGTYTVTGSSGQTNENYDLATLNFNQEVVISKSTTNIQLTAIYDCLLLMFDKTTITNAYFYDGTSQGISVKLYSQDENIIYIFLPNSFLSLSKITYQKVNVIEKSTIYLSPLEFQLGYYYYFNDITGSFDVPPMVG